MIYSIQSDLVTPDIVTIAYLVTQSVFPSIFISAQSDIVTNSFSHIRQTMSKPCPKGKTTPNLLRKWRGNAEEGSDSSHNTWEHDGYPILGQVMIPYPKSDCQFDQLGPRTNCSKRSPGPALTRSHLVSLDSPTRRLVRFSHIFPFSHIGGHSHLCD